MTYKHFNKSNGYPYGNLPDPTRTKDYKQERERIRAIMRGNASYNHIEKTYRIERIRPYTNTNYVKRYVEDGEFSFSVEHRLKTEDGENLGNIGRRAKKLEV